MASRLELFTVTCPPGTLQSAPIVVDTLFDIGQVDRVEILVPPGHSGLTGFQLRHSGAGVFPREDNKFVTADSEIIKWDVDDVPTSGRWALRVFNADIYPHSWYVRYLVREIGVQAPISRPPLDIQQPDQVAPSIENVEPPEYLAVPGV